MKNKNSKHIKVFFSSNQNEKKVCAKKKKKTSGMKTTNKKKKKKKTPKVINKILRATFTFCFGVACDALAGWAEPSLESWARDLDGMAGVGVWVEDSGNSSMPVDQDRSSRSCDDPR